jgi:Asp-tRNA(Asn)/Glu-tRNA(Gln) amidotransferase C subunit
LEAIEERGTQEVVDCNLAIEALKKEVETVEGKKTWLAGELGGLCTAQVELEELQKKIDLLNKEADGAKAVEQLATERALKVIEMADNLRKDVDAERESSAALKEQVDILTKRLEDGKAARLAVAELYVGALEQFGGSTSSLPSEPSAFNILSWMKANFAKLPNFVSGAVDFGALASATKLWKMLM